MFSVTQFGLKKQGECCICGGSDGLRMQCGHYICQTDVLENARHQIKSRSHKITCAQCTEIIDLDHLMKVDVLSDEIKRQLTKEISVLNAKEMQQCPSCWTYLEREDTKTNRTQCPKCSKPGKPYHFCWICYKVWKNPGSSGSCGNKDCGMVNFELLKKTPMKVFPRSVGITSAPSYRACPGCYTIIEHVSGCSEMTCKKCSKVFCFICLRNRRGSSNICVTPNTWGNQTKCAAAPIQDLEKTLRNTLIQ